MSMKAFAGCALLIGLVGFLVGWGTPLDAIADADAAVEGPSLAHCVYFSLKEDSPANRERLIAGCKKYLTGHDGTLWFGVGPEAPEFQRDVNDRDFDVALIVVFKNKESHDLYQSHPRHTQFIAEISALWEKVRVFDSYVTGASDQP